MKEKRGREMQWREKAGTERSEIGKVQNGRRTEKAGEGRRETEKDNVQNTGGSMGDISEVHIKSG